MGLVKGTFKGLLGVVVKPITGVIDLGSNLTQGVQEILQKNTQFKVERVWTPKVFY